MAAFHRSVDEPNDDQIALGDSRGFAISRHRDTLAEFLRHPGARLTLPFGRPFGLPDWPGRLSETLGRNASESPSRHRKSRCERRPAGLPGKAVQMGKQSTSAPIWLAGVVDTARGTGRCA